MVPGFVESPMTDGLPEHIKNIVSSFLFYFFELCINGKR